MSRLTCSTRNTTAGFFSEFRLFIKTSGEALLIFRVLTDEKRMPTAHSITCLVNGGRGWMVEVPITVLDETLTCEMKPLDADDGGEIGVFPRMVKINLDETRMIEVSREVVISDFI